MNYLDKWDELPRDLSASNIEIYSLAPTPFEIRHQTIENYDTLILVQAERICIELLRHLYWYLIGSYCTNTFREQV